MESYVAETHVVSAVAYTISLLTLGVLEVVKVTIPTVPSVLMTTV